MLLLYNVSKSSLYFLAFSGNCVKNLSPRDTFALHEYDNRAKTHLVSFNFNSNNLPPLQLLFSERNAPMYTAKPATDSTATSTKNEATARAMVHTCPLGFTLLWCGGFCHKSADVLALFASP